MCRSQTKRTIRLMKLDDEPTPTDYDHSEPLDVHRWSDYPEVNRFVDRLYDLLFYDLLFLPVADNKRIAKRHLKVLLLDLYVRWTADPSLLTSIARGSTAYKAKSRYNELHVSRKILPVVDALVAAGYLNQKDGFQDTRAGGSSRVSRIWTSETLKAEFEACQIKSEMVSNHPARETVVLKDDEGNLVEYEDTPFTSSLRASLNRYNELLLHTEITHPKGYTHSSFTYCVFNRSSWDLGGRFYNAWQNIPSDERQGLAFDGVPTIEIDYSSFHPYLIYAELGLKLPISDPYAHSQFSRSEMKSMFLVMINCANERQALRAYKDPETNKPVPFAVSRPILEAIKRKHPQIADAFCSDRGIKLMRTDADIARYVIDGFVLAGKPIIPVHDSFIVQAPQLEALLELMYMALRSVLGHQVVRLTQASLPKVKVKVPEQARCYLPPRPYRTRLPPRPYRTREAASEYLMALPRGANPRFNTKW